MTTHATGPFTRGPLFFLHVPKTAGTSLNAIVESHFKREQVFPSLFTEDLPQLPPEELSHYLYFRGHLHYDAVVRLLGRPPITLTLLRDPVEQYLSTVAHLKRFSPSDWLDAGERNERYVAKVRTLPLEDLVYERSLFGMTRNQQVALLLPQPLKREFLAPWRRSVKLRKRVWPVNDRDRSYAKNLLNGFALVGLSERFQESLFLLAHRFGWYPATDYQRLNRGANKLESTGVSPSVLDRIRELNAADLELYDHASRLFSKRYREMEIELLQAYGRARHAHLEPPLPLEITRELLEANYESRFRERHNAESALHFTFDQPIQGASHWHSIEDVPIHGPARWSGPGTSAYLDFHLSTDAALTIRFCILMGITPEVVEGLQTRINGELVAVRTSRDERGAYLFEGEIPREALLRRDGLARFTFEVQETIAPSTLDPLNEDTRSLGALFHWIEIRPTATTE